MTRLGSLIPWRDRNAVSRQEDAPYDPFVSFRREVDSLFDDFFKGAFSSLPAAYTGSPVAPTIDVEDNEKDVVVTAELPGLDEKDFEVTLTGDVLTIKGEKKDSQEENRNGARYVERRYGAFQRSLRLPFEAGDQDVEANYDKGVLTVRVPKPADLTREPKRIAVRSASA